MEISDILILIAISALAVAIFYKDKAKKGDDKSTLLLQNQMNEINRALRDQSGQSTKIIREITKELTKVGEGQKQVFDLAKQLESLQNILKNPKQRGMFGEYTLEVLLKGAFNAKQYQMQYKFSDGEIVDAVLFMSYIVLLWMKMLFVEPAV